MSSLNGDERPAESKVERMATPIEVARTMVSHLREGFRLNVPRDDICERFEIVIVQMLRARDASSAHAVTMAPKLAESLRDCCAALEKDDSLPPADDLVAARVVLAEWKIGAP